MIGKTIAELHPGERAEMARVVEEDDIASFIDAVGDLNPVHSDVDYAATTPFKSPIAPGVFTAGLISAVIGTRLPGPGAVYLSQSLKFVKPVRAGDTITARGRRARGAGRAQSRAASDRVREPARRGSAVGRGVGDAVEGAGRLRGAAPRKLGGGAGARAVGHGRPGRAALGRARHISSPPLIESSAPVM